MPPCCDAAKRTRISGKVELSATRNTIALRLLSSSLIRMVILFYFMITALVAFLVM